MFKKGPDIDKKRLLAKASDVKKDSLSRLKNFKTLIEHLDFNEITILFKSHFSFIYHTFIDSFSNFDCNSKHRREDLDCILFMLDKILIYNPDLVKKRWQFYSITFVMQKLLHKENTHVLRQEGIRLFLLWYQILNDDNAELETMFASIVPGLAKDYKPVQYQQQNQQPQQRLQSSASNQQAKVNMNQLCPPDLTSHYNQSQQQQQQQQQNLSYNRPDGVQLPIKLCSIEPLIPTSQNEQLPTDETSFYLDCLLQNMVTITTEPHWNSQDDAKRNQEQGFAFLFNLFRKIYLQSLFPQFDQNSNLPTKACLNNHTIQQYADDINPAADLYHRSIGHANNQGSAIDNHDNQVHSTGHSSSRSIINKQTITLNEQANNMHRLSTDSAKQTIRDQDYAIITSNYQAIVIKWLTKILRQDIMPGQDELIKAGTGGTNDGLKKQNSSTGLTYLSESISSNNFQNMETSSNELEIARRVIGTWPENIAIVHELFKRAFLNYLQPASMKRVVNLYKEWICNSKSNQQSYLKLGYTSFGDLLQVFVLNSSNAFLTKVDTPQMLEEQVEVCKRIMNIYRYMVMKIYMNTTTWEHLLNVMLSITEKLFPIQPPEHKDVSIGGRLAPAFFQTFVVSWIRANLYVHISSKMWTQFHLVLKNRVKWRELIEEWSTTMYSLTRVLVKHVYGLNLSDLPLDKPQDRRRRPRAIQSFSNNENSPHTSGGSMNQGTDTRHDTSKRASHHPTTASRAHDGNSHRMSVMSMREMHARMARSNSEGFIMSKDARIYFASLKPDYRAMSHRMRKIKSEYLLFETSIDATSGINASLPLQNDALESANIKDANLIIDQPIDDAQMSTDSVRSSNSLETTDSRYQTKNNNPKSDSNNSQKHTKANSNKCVLLGGTIRGWTPENSIIMWRRMLGLFGNINDIDDPDNHLIAIRGLAVILCEFIKTRENLGVSVDNQSTPEQPNLVPPYIYNVAWLLQATHLSDRFRASRLTAYKLLCLLTIRRHDIEIQPQYYSAFYEALYRGLMSSDIQIHTSIIKNSTRILSLELPGATFLVQSLFDRSRSILLNSGTIDPTTNSMLPPKDQCVQLLNSILALHKPIRKLMVLKPESSSSVNMTLVAVGDIKTRIFETLLASYQTLASDTNTPLEKQTFFKNNLNSTAQQQFLHQQQQQNHDTRLKILYSMALFVYQELQEQNEFVEIDRLFEVFSDELRLADQHSDRSDELLRNISDLIRLFADQAPILCKLRPKLITKLLMELSDLISRLGKLTYDEVLATNFNKERFNCLLICLEDWCIAVGKSFIMKPIPYRSLTNNDDEQSDDHSKETISSAHDQSNSQSLISFILQCLDTVIQPDQLDNFSDNTSIVGIGPFNKGLRRQSTSAETASQNSKIAISSEPTTAPVIPNRDRTATEPTQTISSGLSIYQTPINLGRKDLSRDDENLKSARLLCKMSRQRLITFIGHYPLRQLGPASLSCCLNESDFINQSNDSNSTTDQAVDNVVRDLTNDLTILVIDDDTIISFIEQQTNTGNDCIAHIILRNPCGKYSWDASRLDLQLDLATINSRGQSKDSAHELDSIVVDPETFQQEDMRSSMRYDSSDMNEDRLSTSSLSSRLSTNRDHISDILNYLSSGGGSLSGTSGSGTSTNGSSSINSQQSSHKKRNSALSVTNPKFKIAQAEETMIALLVNQRFQEINYCERNNCLDKIVLKVGPKTSMSHNHESDKYEQLSGDDNDLKISSTKQMSTFDQCRQFIQQLGYLSWEKRNKVDSLKRSARLMRELKNLDSQINRETHKIAVIYVANGQEDKLSILSNTTGSRAFEEFVSGLGWEVNLATHLGFKGGLQSNKSTGETSPYYCNSTTEIMYHVSTRIPVQSPSDDESLNKKLRHLGNDEIHIIWSEHSRDYRRGIIPTEFGDVIIAIYPMLTFQGYCRVQLLLKPDVPSFGPLYDNCVVHQSSLASLVRATAINASRSKRLKMPHYLSNYEERSRLIGAIIQNHKANQSFEEFAVQLYPLGCM